MRRGSEHGSDRPQSLEKGAQGLIKSIRLFEVGEVPSLSYLNELGTAQSSRQAFSDRRPDQLIGTADHHEYRQVVPSQGRKALRSVAHGLDETASGCGRLPDGDLPDLLRQVRRFGNAGSTQ